MIATIYNEKVKGRFMWESERELRRGSNAYVSYATMFQISGAFESRAGKDLAELSADELKKVCDLFAKHTSDRVLRYTTNLLRYLRWYKNKYPDKDIGAAWKWVMGQLDKYRISLVASPTHLQLELNKIFRPEESDTIDNIYRTYFWLAFSGLRDKENACKVSIDDVRIDEMKFFANGVSFYLYPQSIKAVSRAAKCTSLNYEHPNYKGGIVSRDRYDSQMLLRGIKQDADIESLMVGVKKKTAAVCAKDPTAKRLTYRSVYDSGLFYRQLDLEASGMDVDFRDDIMKMRDVNGYSTEQSLNVVIDKTHGRLKDEYYVWKYLLYNI